ncbi:uncharacterized protein LOC122504210 [Leptopilina heterotoma]|uniref:uncharacterized protein LOC122504210 n=1 Tax=Leptopilina heterotoma TaxID=63436 RepID=UPI001CA82471|nr:uncharacterized protein LOC122504210 [Leptopilina heterotoma]
MAQGNPDMEQKLRELNCLFTWDTNEYSEDLKKVTCESDGYIYLVPQHNLMKQLALNYQHILNEDYDKADETIREMEKIIPHFIDLRKEVAEHFLESTKVYNLLKKGNNDEVNLLLENIKDIEDKKYLPVITEFKAMLLSLCKHSDRAIELAKIALEYDPDISLCYFIIGKNLRSIRRNMSCFTTPSDEEISHFSKAYELEKNPQYGIFLGQAFKESNSRQKANTILQEIHEMNIPCPKINLRLSLYFLQNQFLDEAEKCLDFVETIRPESSWFLHYKGLYLMRRQKYQEAAECFKRTENEKNFGADLGYAKCMRIQRKRFDYVKYFLELLEKYKGDEEGYKQKELLLHIAFSYFNIKRDIREAIKYFLQAFQMDLPKFDMSRYHDVFTGQTINVYLFLCKEVFTKVEEYREKKIINLPEEIVEANETLKKICDEYQKSCRRDFRNNHASV